MESLSNYLPNILKKNISKGQSLFKNHRKTLILGLSLIIILAVLFTFFPKLWWIIYILLGGISMLPQLWLRSYFAFELCTFFTILGGMQFGPLAGAVIGACSIGLGLGIAMQYGIGTPLSIILFALMGFAASFFPLSSMLWAGIIFFITYDAIMTMFYTFAGYPLSGNISYLVTHFFFNLLIFKFADAFLLRLF